MLNLIVFVGPSPLSQVITPDLELRLTQLKIPITDLDLVNHLLTLQIKIIQRLFVGKLGVLQIGPYTQARS